MAMTHLPDPSALIDPELRGALALLPPLHALGPDTLVALRETMHAASPGPEVADPFSVSEIVIPGNPPVRAILYRPEREAVRGALLWLHGGGFVTGSAARDDLAVRAIATAMDCVALSVDYRLAPESPFPGALDNAHAALAWLHGNAGPLGVDPTRIAVRGNSAGGGIAAALALRARDEGRYSISLLMLVYPMLDDRTGEHPVAGREVWTAGANRFGWASYLGTAAPDGALIGQAVPARAKMLVGLPPTWLGCGALDLFIDENLAFARRLIRGGVSVEMHIYPGAYHGFNLIASAGVAQRFDRDLRAALGRAMQPDLNGE